MKPWKSMRWSERVLLLLTPLILLGAAAAILALVPLACCLAAIDQIENRVKGIGRELD